MVVKVTLREYEELKQLRTLVDEVLDGQQSENMESAESWYRRAMFFRGLPRAEQCQSH